MSTRPPGDTLCCQMPSSMHAEVAFHNGTPSILAGCVCAPPCHRPTTIDNSELPATTQGALPAGSTDTLMLPHIAARGSAVAPEPAADPLSPDEQVHAIVASVRLSAWKSRLSCARMMRNFNHASLRARVDGRCSTANAQVMSAPPQHVSDSYDTDAAAPATVAPASLAALAPGTDLEAGPPQPITLSGICCLLLLLPLLLSFPIQLARHLASPRAGPRLNCTAT